MFEIEPGVVLAQFRHQVHHPPIGQNDLQPKAEIARIAIAQHIRATCICRQIATNHRGATGSKNERKDQIMGIDCLVYTVQHSAAFHDGDLSIGLNFPNGIHPI